MVRFFNLLTADAIQEGDFAINASFLFWQAPRRCSRPILQADILSSATVRVLLGANLSALSYDHLFVLIYCAVKIAFFIC